MCTYTYILVIFSDDKQMWYKLYIYQMHRADYCLKHFKLVFRGGEGLTKCIRQTQIKKIPAQNVEEGGGVVASPLIDLLGKQSTPMNLFC